jgi:hypothetical protein
MAKARKVDIECSGSYFPGTGGATSHSIHSREGTLAEQSGAQTQQGKCSSFSSGPLNYSGAPFPVFKVDLFLAVAI